MELDLNKKLIDFLNREYDVDFNKNKIVNFCIYKNYKNDYYFDPATFLIECENRYFFIQSGNSKKKMYITFIEEVFPQKGNTIKNYIGEENKKNIYNMYESNIFYSFDYEDEKCIAMKNYLAEDYSKRIVFNTKEKILTSNVMSILMTLN